MSLVATASITSCSLPSDESNGISNHSASSSSSDIEKQPIGILLETFLFSGFKLIVNARTVEVKVYAIRSAESSSNKMDTVVSSGKEDGEECYSYLTTCRDEPVAKEDLPPMDVKPCYVNGIVDGEVASGDMDNASCDDGFYKFSYAIPGGPKQMKKVQLKFIRIGDTPSSEDAKDISTILVRKAVIKGRLKGRLSESNTATPPCAPTRQHQSVPKQNGDSSSRHSDHSTSARQRQSSPTQNGHGNRRRVPNLDDDDEGNLRDLGRHLQQMRQNGDMDPRENLGRLHIRKQAEILSKVPGVNLFIRNFEELTTTKSAKMLAGMEGRIMSRLDEIMERMDGIDRRLDAIEESLKGAGRDEESVNVIEESLKEEDACVFEDEHDSSADQLTDAPS